MTKVCTKCKVEKDLIEFYKSVRNPDGLHYQCKDCHKSQTKRCADNLGKDMNQYKERGKRLFGRYGLTEEEYREYSDIQRGCCDICKGSLDTYGTPNVDHDHDTGEVRSLLCGSCNKGIGMLMEDSKITKGAMDYLENWGR